MKYDEDAILAILKRLFQFRRVLFACSCAERLAPSYRWFCIRHGLNDFTVLREPLDTAWLILSNHEDQPPSEIAHWREQVEALVCSVDYEDDFPGAAVAQNAVASAAYAFRTWITSDPNDAMLSARQLYEAADSVVQHGAAVQSYVDEIDPEPPVQLMLKGIQMALQDSLPVPMLRTRAEADGREFLGFLDQD